jgi:hypothetical protein
MVEVAGSTEVEPGQLCGAGSPTRSGATRSRMNDIAFGEADLYKFGDVGPGGVLD